MILMGIELMLNAANINIVAFSNQDQSGNGLVMSVLVIVVAACEVAIALAIIIKVFNHFKTLEIDKINELKD